MSWPLNDAPGLVLLFALARAIAPLIATTE